MQEQKRPHTRIQQQISTSVNRYNVLQTLIEPLPKAPIPKYEQFRLMKRRIPRKKKQKIVIIGDRHAKGRAAEIKHKFGETFEVIGYVQPGSKLEEITYMARKEIDELTKKDMVVVWGGANNIAKNESEKDLEYLSNFVKQRMNTNIILVGAPQRHDLLTESCVNEEVVKYNRVA